MTDSSPLVSVIIRTKDRPQLLLEAVRSVLQQQYARIEILVVNDGGEDVQALLPDTANWPGKSLRYIHLQPGQGRSAAANRGLEAAAGELLIFLDDDDWFEEVHIGGLVQALHDNPAYRLAYSGVRAVFPYSLQENASLQFNYPFDPVRLMVENYIPIHAVLFSRELVEQGCRFDSRFDRLEDWDFWLQAVAISPFLHVNQCSANYRIDQQSGYGAKQEKSVRADRLALLHKWLPRWHDDQLLEVLERSRQFPRLEQLITENAELKGHIEARTQQVNELAQTLAQSQGNQNQTLHSLSEARDALRQYKEALQQKENNLAEVKDTVQVHFARIEELNSQLQHKEQYLVQLQNDLDLIHRSRSWRLTSPLRHLSTACGHGRWRLQRPLRHLSTATTIYQQQGLRALLSRVGGKLRQPRGDLPRLQAESQVHEGWQALSFPIHPEPLISIVIPVYNKHEYTYHCLKTILQNSADERYEIIVVDDKSRDETAYMLTQMEGIRVISNAENLGFIRSCNGGAREARGEYLVLFNNDTEPKPGWLRALRQTFADFPDAGLVGARLVYPNGILQEAGGIVWQDGSAWNYGRNDDPHKPEYAYCRAVDYCSGACLMIRTAQFSELGMFDEHYVPAYYEDTDLAFKVRQAGLQVYYQPMATIIHFEGITSGTDTSSGIKQYQEINHRKFFQRWRDTLRTHRSNADSPHLEKERQVDKRALVVDARVLMPDNDSGSLRMYSLLLILQKMGYKVTFLPDNLEYNEKYTPRMQAQGMECLYHPYLQSVEQHLQAHGSLYDVVLLSRVDVAENHIAAARRYCPTARILFDTVDLHFLREQRQAQLSNDQGMLESAMVRKRQELGVARQADVTLVVSPVEIDLFRQEAPDVPLALLSNVHKVEAVTTRPFRERKDILFIGSFEHPPNVDAMFWFLDEIFPLLQQDRPDISIRIVGGKVPRRLQDRAGPKVQVTGFVDDIRPLFNDIRVSVAPLRYGAGVKGKINSSMALGVPVVATSVAAEGMGLAHEKDVLIADRAEDFARQIVRLYEDEALWQALVSAGKANIEQHFSFEVAERQLRSILQSGRGAALKAAEVA